MHVLRLLRIFIPLLIVAAIVAGAVLVFTSRSELQRSHRAVETSWTPLRHELDTRFKSLKAANLLVSTVPGPLHAVVADVGVAYTEWTVLEDSDSGVTTEVKSANKLEALGRRLVQAARKAPRLGGNAPALAALAAFARLKGNKSALTAIESLANLSPPEGSADFNAAVEHFEKERNRPASQPAARILGYGSIPSYEATDPG